MSRRIMLDERELGIARVAVGLVAALLRSGGEILYGDWSYAMKLAGYDPQGGEKNPLFQLTQEELEGLVKTMHEVNCAAAEAENALTLFMTTVCFTGGVKEEGGRVVTVADPEWIDLGYAYVAACDALGMQPAQLTKEDEDVLGEIESGKETFDFAASQKEIEQLEKDLAENSEQRKAHLKKLGLTPEGE